ncbi:hypothetical protein THRCLA_00217, partial [Thraustotheca clavata]
IELISGHVHHLSRRVSQSCGVKSTEDIVDRVRFRVAAVQRKYKDLFWAEFEEDQDPIDPEVMKKASAQYFCAYMYEWPNKVAPYLSFAWLATEPMRELFKRHCTFYFVMKLETSYVKIVYLSQLTPRTIQKQYSELVELRQRVSMLEQLLSNQPENKNKAQLEPIVHQGLSYTLSVTQLPHPSTYTAFCVGRTTTAPALFPLSPSKVKCNSNDSEKVSTPGGFAVEENSHELTKVNLTESMDVTTKFMTEHDGTMSVVTSNRTHLYHIIQGITKRIPFKDEQIFHLKKMVDAEFGDVIQVLLELEHEVDTATIERRIVHLLQTGSPSKFFVINHQPAFNASEVPYPLTKIAQAMSTVAKEQEVVVLVSSGAYNPVHMLHIRAFYVARQHIESNYKFPVVGAIISPCHDTYVRTKNRRKPREMIPKSHRLGMLEAATATSSWIEVDKWEITRRRVLDYLSTLTHVREVWQCHEKLYANTIKICMNQFPEHKFRVMYVCGVNTIVKLSHSALREEGFGCIAVCRPNQTQMLVKHLGAKWSKIAIVVEDMGVLTCELERATSFRVRQALVTNEPCAAMVGKHVSDYMQRHHIGDKIAGREQWTSEDRLWRPQDLPHVEYSDMEIQSRTH